MNDGPVAQHDAQVLARQEELRWALRGGGLQSRVKPPVEVPRSRHSSQRQAGAGAKHQRREGRGPHIEGCGWWDSEENRMGTWMPGGPPLTMSVSPRSSIGSQLTPAGKKRSALAARRRPKPGGSPSLRRYESARALYRSVPEGRYESALLPAAVGGRSPEISWPRACSLKPAFGRGLSTPRRQR